MKSLAPAFRCATGLDDVDIFAPAQVAAMHPNDIIPYERLADVVGDVFEKYELHIFIMATGIVVRTIARLLIDKTKDPAVLVMDDNGEHVISLVSGHIGHANEYAIKISKITGAKPVITTATDNSGIMAFDALAAKLGAVVENKDVIKHVSRCMLGKVPVALACDRALYREYYTGNKEARVVHIADDEPYRLGEFQAACVFSEKIVKIPEGARSTTLVIRPKNLVLGVGCNRGTSINEIESAVVQLFSDNSLSLTSIRSVATIDIKSDEDGIVNYAAGIGAGLVCFSADVLDSVDNPELSPPSEYSLKHVGAKGVCEQASLAACGAGGELIVKKQVSGNVTLAVAKTAFSTHFGGGKLYVVGIGPGDIDCMSAHARRVIELCDKVAGYGKYIELVSVLIEGKQIMTTGMTHETERVEMAIDEAIRGANIALVCSGDAGIYGLAGLVYERLHLKGEHLDVEVVPGITAAVSAASIAGAPLTNDFITLSLSDLLTSEDVVRKRIMTAAVSGMVTVVYNPAGRKRREMLEFLGMSFMQCRRHKTVVAVATNVMRCGQKVILTSLENMLEYEIDMNTVLIIGNDDTVVIDGKMVTKRGYENKMENGIYE